MSTPAGSDARQESRRKITEYPLLMCYTLVTIHKRYVQIWIKRHKSCSIEGWFVKIYKINRRLVKKAKCVKFLWLIIWETPGRCEKSGVLWKKSIKIAIIEEKSYFFSIKNLLFLVKLPIFAKRFAARNAKRWSQRGFNRLFVWFNAPQVRRA